MSELMNVKAVIFDCDGTLVDSELLANEVLAEMLSLHGFPMSGREAMSRFLGMKLAKCLSSVEAQFGAKLPEDFVAKLRERTAEVFRERLRPIPGVIDLVRAITLPKCVASSGPREKIELSLSLTGLLPFFADHIYSSYEVGSWKPDPGIFLHAADRLGVKPELCAVIEDSFLGVQAGLSAGMRVFAFQPHVVDPRIPANVSIIRHMDELSGALQPN